MKIRQLSLPSRTRRKLAGFSLAEATVGMGVIGTVIGAMLSGITTGTFTMQMMALSIGGLFGYLAPTFWLKMSIKSNGKALTYGLADALDELQLVKRSLRKIGEPAIVLNQGLGCRLARECGEQFRIAGVFQWFHNISPPARF